MGARKGLPSSVLYSVCFALTLLCGSVPARASGPSDCAGELNGGQQEQRRFCDTFAPCAFVTSIMDTCTQTKSWLDLLRSASPSGEMSVSTVETAVRNSSGAGGQEELSVDAPSAFDCITGNRDLCRQYLRLDPVQIHVVGAPVKRSADLERRARMLALYKEQEQARLRLGGPWTSAESALAACEASRTQSTRAATCQRAQAQVEGCNVARADWGKRKAALLTELKNLTPAVGVAYTPGISPLRGLGRQANSAELWNDTVRGLQSLEMAACPATLPSSFQTPEQALSAWALQEQAVAARIAQCDAMSRDMFDAIDDADANKATSVADAFESTCSNLAASYASRARLARNQINVLRSAEAMPQRSTGYGTSLFKSAVQQANLESQDPAARQARLQAERDALEEQIAREAASGGDGSSFANSMLNVMRITAALQSSRNSARIPVPVAPVAQYQEQTQSRYAPLGSMALPDPGFHPPGQVPVQTGAYYPPLTCARVVATPPHSIFKYCLQNNCSVQVLASVSVGAVTARVGGCAPMSADTPPTLYGVCKDGDFFDRARQQCH